MCRGVYQPNQENGAIDSLADTIFKDLWGLIEPYVPPEEAELGTVFYSLKGVMSTRKYFHVGLCSY